MAANWRFAPGHADIGIRGSGALGLSTHRVDEIPGIDGAGITVGVMSDSYDTNVAPNSATADIATGDLPGAGNPLGNTEPVVVLQDWPASSDEGRAMLQIVHDMAPKARLGFATANGGEVNFANNIRCGGGARPCALGVFLRPLPFIGPTRWWRAHRYIH